MGTFDVVVLPLQKWVGTLPEGGQDISRWTSPLKLFEYMAHEKPIVASDLAVLREVIEPENNALIAPAEELSRPAAAAVLLSAFTAMATTLSLWYLPM
jgi:glycosyltransferase involved in cell wall biosynthesis